MLTALQFNPQKDWDNKTSKGSANRPGEALSPQHSGWWEGKCAGFQSTNSEQVAMPPPAVPLYLWVASPIITALKEASQRYWLISATPTPSPGQIQPGLAGGGRSQRDQLNTPQPLNQGNELPAGCVFWWLSSSLLSREKAVIDRLLGEVCLSFCG